MEYFFFLDKHLPEGVGIEMYGPEHLIWLAAGAALWVTLCVVYRRQQPKARRKMALAVALIILGLETLRIVMQTAAGVFNRTYLPLHLCGLATYFVIFHALRGMSSAGWSAKGNVLLGEVLYSFCMPGAICALVFLDWTRYPVLNIQSIQSFSIHVFLVAYPVMLVAGGDIRPSAKRLPQCLLFIAVLAVPIYILNKIIGTNYFFLNEPSPGSPLELFAGLGNPGYLLGYLPIIGAAWLLLYLPLELWRRVRVKA